MIVRRVVGRTPACAFWMAVLCFILGGVAGAGQEGTSPGAHHNEEKPSEAVERGRSQFQMTCAFCRGPEANGGGTTWLTGTYDPELNLLYWGTGNPHPVLSGQVRPGANLYTCTIVALDPATGRSLWHVYAGGRLTGCPMTYELNGRQYLLAPVDSVLYAWALKAHVSGIRSEVLTRDNSSNE